MNILLVDDHPIIHEVLGAVARAVFPEAAVVHAGTLAEALEQASAAGGVDLVLLDLGLPGCSGLEALAACREAFPRARIVVVSATEDPTSIRRALKSGATGYIPKTDAPPLMSAALRVIAAGGTYVPAQALADEPALTGRQIEVLRFLLQGLTNKEIARRLGIAKDTVKSHIKPLYAALGVATREEAGRAVERRGIRLD